ncbi:hypothetical protein EVAR_84068_1 [Eumeta japonica]|uniref:Uncharacterized protein n=1 Tax=Eumeta variegata TaxID=151549 RepID=A0A4C1UYR0_EUMVA|nr:hypothetical protein EVAR_84068_1 [Eumeta japonica]
MSSIATVVRGTEQASCLVDVLPRTEVRRDRKSYVNEINTGTNRMRSAAVGPAATDTRVNTNNTEDDQHSSSGRRRGGLAAYYGFVKRCTYNTVLGNDSETNSKRSHTLYRFPNVKG